MSKLTDLIEVIPPDREEEPEDIFASAPGFIFTDDLRNFHGDHESIIRYKSKRFGDLHLRTADSHGEEERQLFACLWNAGIKIAELVSSQEADDVPWSVENESVFELGAGVGLSGIVASLAGAKEVVISDYPAPAVIKNITRNVRGAIPKDFESSCRVQGHQWGKFDEPFAIENAHRFTRIIAADCFWMPLQHENLARSMLHFLTLDPAGRVLITAGFHTGRAKLAAFFDTASEEGLEIDDIYEENADGVRREWLKERDGGIEDHRERNKWLVMARLKRRT